MINDCNNKKSKKRIAAAENYKDIDHYQRLLDEVFALNHTKVILKTSYTIFIPHQTLRISKHSVLQANLDMVNLPNCYQHLGFGFEYQTSANNNIGSKVLLIRSNTNTFHLRFSGNCSS